MRTVEISIVSDEATCARHGDHTSTHVLGLMNSVALMYARDHRLDWPVVILVRGQRLFRDKDLYPMKASSASVRSCDIN